MSPKRRRKSFHNGAFSWEEFRKRYLAELQQHRDELLRLAERAKYERVTLVFAAKDEEHNNTVVVEQYLRMLGAENA